MGGMNSGVSGKYKEDKAMGEFKAAMTGFDIDPRFHPEYGAWGTTPVMTEIDIPVLTRCLVLAGGDKALVWFSHDLIGESVEGTDVLRREIADTLDIETSCIVWSTSQTHSSPTFPGSDMPGGSSITVRGEFDPEFCRKERERFMERCVEAVKEAMAHLQPAEVLIGRGYCDNISYDSRFPMPAGGTKFSRNYGEGVQGGKYKDTTVGLLQLTGKNGAPIGTVFNYGCHPATMINDKYLSPDYVGTARRIIEEETGGPAMFVQGFCGNIHNYFMFGKPKHARITGSRLGKAAVAGLRSLVPVRGEPFAWKWRNLDLRCRPMYTREELDQEIRVRREFLEELEDYENAVWVAGHDVPEFFTVEQKKRHIEVQTEYLREGLRILDTGETPPASLKMTVGAVRIGDMAAVLSPGENFALTGRNIRARSPFIHTLLCGDTNGLLGYIGTDDEIPRGGYETDTFWKMLYIGGFRLAPAQGASPTIVEGCVSLLNELRG